MLEPVFTAVAPVLVTAALGYLWTRFGGRLDTETVTALVADIGTPCLVVATLVHTAIRPDAFAAMAAAAALSIGAFLLTGIGVLKLAGLRLRTFLPSLAFPNAGNLGLPLALYAFGPEGLGYAIVVFAFTSIGNNTVGQSIAAGSASWRTLIRLPIIYAVILGLLLGYTHTGLPRWLDNIVTMIAGLVVPLMLMMLGAAIGRLRVRALRRAALITATRIGLGTAIGVLVAWALGLEGAARGVLILQCAMPVAVYNYLFAQRWNNQPDEVAGAVVVSTLASVVTLPLLLAWLLRP
ncbi:MAG TPA: AEC family transporter [Candidatus Cybelea sp.]|nr:AEC family transporter [Candidatus Cybelea sp.]